MDWSPRSTWTPAEIAQVRETFGAADTPEALDLFAPDDWQEWRERVPDGELVGVLRQERESLRRKAAHNRAAAEMGFSAEEAALFGTHALRLVDEGRGAV